MKTNEMKRDCARLRLGLWLAVALMPMHGAGATFDVRDYGAKGDGKTLDTAAVNRAIEACAAAGGGVVRLPAGTYLCGTVMLRSEVTVYLDAGARLAGTADLAEYKTPAGARSYYHALIVGDAVKNVVIAGPGVIDGRKVFDPNGEQKIRGPHTIFIRDSENISVRDVAVVDSANYALFFTACDRLEVRQVKIEGGWDGVHVRGSRRSFGGGASGSSTEHDFTRDVRIIDCQFFTGDDAVCFSNVENSLIRNCVINSSCNGVRITGPVKHLTIEGCLFYGPGVQPYRTGNRNNMLCGVILQPGSWGKTEGDTDDVLISNVTMKNVASPLNFSLTLPGTKMNNLIVNRLSATGVYHSALSVESWTDTPIGRTVLRDVSVEFDDPGGPPRPAGAGKLLTPAEVAKAPVQRPQRGVRQLPAWALFARNASELVLDSVRFGFTGHSVDPRPAVHCENINRLVLGDLIAPPSGAVQAVVLTGIGEIAGRPAPFRPAAAPQHH